MKDKFDFLIFIGRFQPFHSGHKKVVEKALQLADKTIILLGSSHQPHNLRNPWSHGDRDSMIRSVFNPEENKRLITAPLMDVLYNDELWVKNVQQTINGLVTAHHSQLHKTPKVGLIGHSKDHTSYYLNLFPQWQSVAVKDYMNINASDIRESLFSSSDLNHNLIDLKNKDYLPAPVADWVRGYSDINNEWFEKLHFEHTFITSYKKGWDKAPYPPTFVTVDAVVVQSGHILLVERKARPGKGLWALPGGFVDPSEKIENACLRELREETRLKIPEPVLKGSIRNTGVFDDPYRSARGRTITHAFYIELKPFHELPKVKGGDDARRAFWLPLADLNPESMFEDHYFIIQKMLSNY